MSLNLEVIDIGALANDGTGDPLRVAFDKINNNFGNLSALNSGGSEGSLQFKQGNLYQGSDNLIFDTTTNTLNLGANLVPISNSSVSIGSVGNEIAEFHVSNTGFNLGNITVTETGNTLYFPVSVDHNVSASLSGLHDITVSNAVSISKKLTVGNTIKQSFTVVTVTSVPDQIIYQLPAANVVAGTFRITSNEANSFNSQTVTLVATKKNDGLSASFSAYGTVFVGAPVTRYNVDVGYGNLRVMVSPIPNTTVTHYVSFELEK